MLKGKKGNKNARGASFSGKIGKLWSVIILVLGQTWSIFNVSKNINNFVQDSSFGNPTKNVTGEITPTGMIM